MATTDLDALVGMGFEQEKAQMALAKTGSLPDAVDWLDKHADKSVEDLRADDAIAEQEKQSEAAEQAKSLVCNECGKMMRGVAEAEFHAQKSGHSDFSESTEEIKPLTEEEKAAKLTELREKMAARKAKQAEEDKVAAKRNEQISRKKTKETEDLKEQLRIKEQIKDAEKKKKERLEDIEAKKRIQAKIAADKEERRLKAEQEKAIRAGQAVPQAQSSTVVAAVPSKSAAEYTETRLRLQTPNGNVMKSFPVSATLFEVASAVSDEIGLDVESFTQNFPKKTFDREYFGESLKDLKLVPSASLIVK